MGLFDYIRGSSLSDEERIDGIESGELQEWRQSAADGEQWFKRSKFPTILGVPRNDHDAIEGLADDDIDADDDDSECICIDEFGNVEAGSVPPMHLPATGEIKFSTGNEGSDG